MDISIIQKSDGSYDWDCSTGNLSHGDDIGAVVLCSMLTDGLADDTHTAIPYTNRRGWWGSYKFTDYIGFQGWTCFKEAVDTTTLTNTLTNYTNQALQHLITNGMVKSIDVSVTLTGHLKAFILITLNKPDGNKQTYSIYWNEVK